MSIFAVPDDYLMPKALEDGQHDRVMEADTCSICC